MPNAKYYYELTCLCRPDLSETEFKDCQNQMVALCQQEEPALKLEPAKKIRLAYPIKKQTEAFLVSLSFQAEPATVLKIKKEMDNMAKALRFLIVKKRVVVEEPKPELAALTSAKPEEQPPEAQAPIKGQEPGVTPEPKKAKPAKKTASMEDIEKDLEKILGE